VRVSTDPRFSRRRRAVQRGKRRRALFRSLAVGLVVVAVWTTFWSPLFSVRRIKVVGGRHTSAEEIATAAGLDSNDNLLLVSTDEVAARARTLPWVRSADVDRMLPGTIRVRIRERRPLLELSADTGTWTIDRHGRVLETGATSNDLPVLAGASVEAVSPGMEVQAPEARAAVRVYMRLPGSLKRDVVAIFAPTLERITLSLKDDTLVRYGAPEFLAAKNKLVRILRRRLAGRGVKASYIDVRVPRTPAVGGEHSIR
jgi:cell division protein FtsQ